MFRRGFFVGGLGVVKLGCLLILARVDHIADHLCDAPHVVLLCAAVRAHERFCSKRHERFRRGALLDAFFEHAGELNAAGLVVGKVKKARLDEHLAALKLSLVGGGSLGGRQSLAEDGAELENRSHPEALLERGLVVVG